MKNYTKKSLKASNGITLIALVITIIVLLILAGISITMLSGDNGLLNRTTEARSKTIHANVYEQLQLEELAYLSDKTTSKTSSTLIEYLQSKSIIGNEIGEDTGKYQVNVTALLGSRQSLGNGDATVELKDVYMLEKQATSTGSIINTQIATTMPVKIAATETIEIAYKVVYYGNGTSENISLGTLSDSAQNQENVALEDLQALKEHFIGNGYEIWYDEKTDTYTNVNPADNNTSVEDVRGGIGFDDGYNVIIKYKNNYYIVTFDINDIGQSVELLDATNKTYTLDYLLFETLISLRCSFSGVEIQEKILPSYSPKMTVESIGEFDLTPYINDSGTIDLSLNGDFEEYDGMMATISLTFNGEIISWTGLIRSKRTLTPVPPGGGMF